jgi:preprotein translocase subunit YajC
MHELMFIAPALAQAATDGGGAAAGPAGISGMVLQFAPFILIFVIMYFLIIRPQRNRQKQTQEMIANIRRGDTVVTSGGFIGKVAKVDDNELQVDLAEPGQIRVRLVRSAVTEVRAKGEPVKEES